nr:endo-1,4-beta-xylanase [Sphingomonas jejuensis]
MAATASARGRRFGSAVAWGRPGADRGSFANPAYAALLKRDCTLLVAENEMKWQALRPAADRYAFDRFDAIMAWSDASGMVMRGHNLLWHQDKWLPRWLFSHSFGTDPAAEGRRLIVDHIDTVCARYGTRIPSYDVVNEAVRPDDGGLYDTPLSRAIGSAEATIDLAFRTARAAAPQAELVYNDYMSWEPGNGAHRDGVLRLLRGFRERDVPVDALGIQSHLVTQSDAADGGAAALTDDWRRFVDAVVAMDYRLLITELDVRDNNLPADPAVRDRVVAGYARAYLDVMLAYPQLRDVLAWGMCDRYSWIEGFEARSDGAPRRPCPYDAQFRAKPLRDAINASLEAAAPLPA